MIVSVIEKEEAVAACSRATKQSANQEAGAYESKRWRMSLPVAKNAINRAIHALYYPPLKRGREGANLGLL